MIYQVPPSACEFRFIHASGPGGQHVNKTSTAVELRVDVTALGLPPAVELRLIRAVRNRMNKEGQLIIQADKHRSQLKNRKDAMQRLTDMIDAARIAPKRRIATKPSAGARKRRMDSKKLRGRVKSQRRKPAVDS